MIGAAQEEPPRCTSSPTRAPRSSTASPPARPRLFRRFRGIALAACGQPAAGMAAALGCTRRAVQNWARRYNQGGPVVLADSPGRGTRSLLGPAEHPRLLQRIEA